MTSGHKYMIQPVTNYVFPYMENIVEEKGWKTYDGKLPVIDMSVGKRVLFDGVVFEDDEASERELKASLRAEFDRKKGIIKAAFKEMAPIDFATATGAPKLSVVEKAVGFAPTKEERDAAYLEYKAEKEGK